VLSADFGGMRSGFEIRRDPFQVRISRKQPKHVSRLRRALLEGMDQKFGHRDGRRYREEVRLIERGENAVG
jgi:hypothetical protein